MRFLPFRVTRAYRYSGCSAWNSSLILRASSTYRARRAAGSAFHCSPSITEIAAFVRWGLAADSFGRVSLLYSRKLFIGRRSRVPSGAWLLGGNCGDDSAPSVVAGVSAGKANGFVSSDGTGEPRGDARELSELDEPASSSSSLYHEFCLGSREERRDIVG